MTGLTLSSGFRKPPDFSTIISPSFTPSVISTKPSWRAPTVTGRMLTVSLSMTKTLLAPLAVLTALPGRRMFCLVDVLMLPRAKLPGFSLAVPSSSTRTSPLRVTGSISAAFNLTVPGIVPS